MSHLQIPNAFDSVTQATSKNSGAGSNEYVHIRIWQRPHGWQPITIVEGLRNEIRYNKLLKDLKRKFSYNGSVFQDPELGQVIQLQRDQQNNVSTFFIQAGIVNEEKIMIHRF